LVNVTHLGFEVAPVSIDQDLFGDLANPDEKGYRGLVKVVLNPPGRFDEGILQDILAIDFADDSAIESEGDHSQQLFLVSMKEFRNRVFSPVAQLVQFTSEFESVGHLFFVD